MEGNTSLVKELKSMTEGFHFAGKLKAYEFNLEQLTSG